MRFVKAETSSGDGFIEKKVMQRISSDCSNESNEETKDVDNTCESSWRMVGGLVVIPKSKRPFTVA